jgi:hypothetical protein
MKLFETEQEAINWVQLNIPFAVKPKKMAKARFVYPFVSHHAHDQVVNCLGRELFKRQESNPISEKT